MLRASAMLLLSLLSSCLLYEPAYNPGDSSSDDSAAAAGTTDDPATTSTTSDTPTTGTSTVGCNTLDCTSSTGPQCPVEGGEPGCVIQCDVLAKNCPEGQKCAPWANDGSASWNATKCVDVMPNAGKPGDPCTVVGVASGVDSCEKSSICWDVSPETGEGTCVAFCMGPPEALMCPDSIECVVSGGVLFLCVPGCDPLAQDCPNMDLCLPEPMGDRFTCVLDASGDMGKQNDPCASMNACDPGLFCAEPALAVECDPMAAGCCLPFCDLSNPVCTNEGAQCLAWYEVGMAPPDLANVGLCGLMQ